MSLVIGLVIMLNVIGNLDKDFKVFVPWSWIIFICWTLFYVGKLFIMSFI